MMHLNLSNKNTNLFILKRKNLSKILLSLALGNYFLLSLSASKAFAGKTTPVEQNNNFANKSFVSKAVRRSGSAVVTLETQRTVQILKHIKKLRPGLTLISHTMGMLLG